MREDFLHYVWKHKMFATKPLQTTNGQTINVITVGQHNTNAGPDFFNAQLHIGNQLWAGNVEMHIKSSDWYVHHHEVDDAYNTVILHVVWEHDVEVFYKNNTAIPTLVLKQFVNPTLLNNYKLLLESSKQWINCAQDFASVSNFDIENWLEYLFFERIERKANQINTLLTETQNNWEAVLFIMLAKNFGLKVNGDAFFSMAKSMDYAVIRKSQESLPTLEALFFGQLGMLNQELEDVYFKDLESNYQYLKRKFNLQNKGVIPVQFFRLRPPNFPTIRISQLAQLYHVHHQLFSKISSINKLADFYPIFQVSTSTYWDTHYTFQKTSKKTKKIISKEVIDLLLINTLLPLRFCYAKYQGKDENDFIITTMSQIPIEKNSIVSAFQDLKSIAKSALHSQALIQLKTEYCLKNLCLECRIGNKIIHKNL